MASALVRRGLAFPAPSHRRQAVLRLMGDQPEKEFMGEVLKFLRLRGWELVYHTYDSTKSIAGFPDIIALRRARGLALECKSQHGRARPDQERWVAGFAALPCFDAAVVRPSDWPWILKVAQ